MDVTVYLISVNECVRIVGSDRIRKWMIFENPWWIRKIEILFILLMEYSD
jgi:hypothetical protein